MSYYFTNVISMRGDPKRIAEIKEKYSSAEYGESVLDFEKVIPIPEKYKLPDSWNWDDPAIQNTLKWYDRFWGSAEWGTAYFGFSWEELELNEPTCASDEFNFTTNHLCPHKVVAKLAELNPDVKFIHRWAGEETGISCGIYTYENGNITGFYEPEEESQEAVELSCAVKYSIPERFTDWRLHSETNKCPLLHMETLREYIEWCNDDDEESAVHLDDNFWENFMHWDYFDSKCENSFSDEYLRSHKAVVYRVTLTSGFDDNEDADIYFEKRWNALDKVSDTVEYLSEKCAKFNGFKKRYELELSSVNGFIFKREFFPIGLSETDISDTMYDCVLDYFNRHFCNDHKSSTLWAFELEDSNDIFLTLDDYALDGDVLFSLQVEDHNARNAKPDDHWLD